MPAYTKIDIEAGAWINRLEFLGDSLARLRDFPEVVRQEAGVQLHKVQLGLEPSDWKPMTAVGLGVREIRIRDAAGAFRAPYVARIEYSVFVLHPFQKKTQQTAKVDLDLAASRLRRLVENDDGTSGL